LRPRALRTRLREYIGEWRKSVSATSAVLVGLLLAGILLLARQIASWGSDGKTPRQRPAWLGPDPVEVERALARLAAELRSTAGVQPATEDPAVAELARHHAHDMASRGFCADADPEGVDLQERRRRLHPDFAGVVEQWFCLVEPDPAHTAEGLARDLLRRDDQTAEWLARGKWNRLGVGLAIEAGRMGCCLVAATRWATLHSGLKGDLHPSGWTVEGSVEPSVAIEQLGARPAGCEAELSPASIVEDERFQLHVDIPAGEWVEIVCGEDVGLRRKS